MRCESALQIVQWGFWQRFWKILRFGNEIGCKRTIPFSCCLPCFLCRFECSCQYLWSSCWCWKVSSRRIFQYRWNPHSFLTILSCAITRPQNTRRKSLGCLWFTQTFEPLTLCKHCKRYVFLNKIVWRGFNWYGATMRRLERPTCGTRVLEVEDGER